MPGHRGTCGSRVRPVAITTTRAGIVPAVVWTLQWPLSRSRPVTSTPNRASRRWCAAYCSRYCTNWSRATHRPKLRGSGSPEDARANGWCAGAGGHIGRATAPLSVHVDDGGVDAAGPQCRRSSQSSGTSADDDHIIHSATLLLMWDLTDQGLIRNVLQRWRQVPESLGVPGRIVGRPSARRPGCRASMRSRTSHRPAGPP